MKIYIVSGGLTDDEFKELLEWKVTGICNY